MLVVQAAGTITPVGLSLVDTMAAIYTGVQLFEDLSILDDDGEPLSGMKVRFESDLAGPARVLTMANAVVDECTIALDSATRVPLILCCPEAGVFGEDDAAHAKLLSSVIAESAIPIDNARSKVIARGRDGVLEALEATLTILKDGSVPYCLVGGVDSFVDPVRLGKLRSNNRLLTETDKDGFKAGEAGAMLLLSNRPDADTMAVFLGAGGGREESTRANGGPVTGAGLQQAIATALAQAKVPFDGLSCLAHDLSGEERYFDELNLAVGRLARGKPHCSAEDPGLSVGETGAAAAFLSIALLAFLHWKGVNKSPSLGLITADGSDRGAVVLGPYSTNGR
jgi:3-oxoacyl-[acyl-carrier-protein] synthase-1